MKINKTILLGALTICALSANAKVMDSSVATVNSKPILSSQYDKMTKAVLAQYEQRAPQVLQDQNNVNALKEEALAALGEAATEEEIAAALSNAKAALNNLLAANPKPVPTNTNLGLILGLSIGGGVLLAGGVVALVLILKKKKKVA